MEVIKLFSVIKLAKIVKKKNSTTFVYGYRGFGRYFNGNSTQLKKNGQPEVITDFFSSVCATLPLTHRCVHTDGALGLCQSNAPGCLGVKPRCLGVKLHQA